MDRTRFHRETGEVLLIYRQTLFVWGGGYKITKQNTDSLYILLKKSRCILNSFIVCENFIKANIYITRTSNLTLSVRFAMFFAIFFYFCHCQKIILLAFRYGKVKIKSPIPKVCMRFILIRINRKPKTVLDDFRCQI